MDKLQLLLSELMQVDVVKAQWVGKQPPAAEFITRISTDSRTAKQGELFVALKGDNFDGHDFIAQVSQQGVLASMVNKKWYEEFGSFFPDLNFIVVQDTLIAYQEFAAYYRRKFNIPVIAITGSAGKTTTKEIIASVLEQKYKVLRNLKSFNNHVGVPATLFEIRPEHEIVLTEVGTNHFGELDRLSYLAQPTACVVTNIGYAHLEFFKSLDGVAKAKMEVFNHIRESGLAFYNADDVKLAEQTFPVSEVVTFGVENNATVKGEIKGCDEMARYTFTVLNETITLGIAGRHNVTNALAAVAVGQHFGLNAGQIKTGVEKALPFEKRMQVHNFSGIRVVDDSYNSNPGSCYAGLATLADMTVGENGRKIAVIGDMLELGEFSKAEHEKIAEIAFKFNIDALFLFGRETSYTAKQALKKNFQYTGHFEDKKALYAALKKYVHKNDIVLVKGSRSMRMETIVEDFKNF